MEHLVERHLGGHWIDSSEEYCDECGDYDRVLLSWLITIYLTPLKNIKIK